jgi:hypothetical protein
MIRTSKVQYSKLRKSETSSQQRKLHLFEEDEQENVLSWSEFPSFEFIFSLKNRKSNSSPPQLHYIISQRFESI